MICVFFQPGLLAGQCAVELEKMNVLFPGIDNPISIVVNDLPDSCLVLEPGVGKLVRQGNSHYLWSGIPDTNVVSLVLMDSCHREVVGKRNYRVMGLPVEMLLGARFGGNKGLIDVQLFQEQGGIAAVLVDGIICGSCDMVGYTARFYSKKSGEIWTGFNAGARFEGEVLRHVLAVQPGDWVRFDGFSYRCPGMIRRRFHDEELHFKIK